MLPYRESNFLLLTTTTRLFAHQSTAKKKKPPPTTTTTTNRRPGGRTAQKSSTANIPPVNISYTIRYSPNFQRHIVSSTIETTNTNSKTTVQKTKKKTVIRSFEWLDEAREAYPTAILENLSLPPPPSLFQQQQQLGRSSSGHYENNNNIGDSSSSSSSNHHSNNEDESVLLFSRIVAGAGTDETSAYYNNYQDQQSTNNDTTIAKSEIKSSSTTKLQQHSNNNSNNNGGSYLLKFLQKLYSALPTITPAEIHRGVLDKFPKLAFYDAALVHERLFFLLAPLPPDDVMAQIRTKATTSMMGTTTTTTRPPQRKKAGREKKKVSAPKDDDNSWSDDMDEYNMNATRCCDDFPLLFYKYGYGAGLSQSQLVQALQPLPQFWLPVYLGDASVASKKPQDILPYVFYHLSSHPEALSDTNSQLDPLLTGTIQADVASLAHAISAVGLTWDQCRLLLLALPSLRTCEVEPNWEFYSRGPVRSTLMEGSLIYLRLRLQLDPMQVFALIKTHTRLSTYNVFDRLKPILDALQYELDLDSQSLKQLILRMPSLLGMSKSSLLEHIQFFTEDGTSNSPNGATVYSEIIKTIHAPFSNPPCPLSLE